MAITAPTVQGDFSGFLRPDRAGFIFERAARASAVQALVQRVPLGISGVEIPVVTSKPTAGWVAEGGKKPATSGALALKTMTPKKLAAIAVVSAEVVRANPGGYIDAIQPQLAEAFALAFDAAVLHGTNTPFGAGTNLSATTKAVELGTATAAQGGLYTDLNNVLKLLVNDKKRHTGWALDNIMEPTLNGALDLQGRPLFVAPVYSETALATASLLGRRAELREGIATADGKAVVGFAGDWSQAAWGAVGGISYDVSTQAAVTINGNLVSLWEHNLLAIRAEAEYGWIVNDLGSFVKLTDAT